MSLKFKMHEAKGRFSQPPPPHHQCYKETVSAS